MFQMIGPVPTAVWVKTTLSSLQALRTHQIKTADAPAAVAPLTNHILVIGSGLAAYSLANAIKKLDGDAMITLVTRDGGENYSKPMISTGYTKKFEAEQLATQTAENMSENLGITVRHGPWSRQSTHQKVK
jgi:hypothetical protein